MTEKMWCENEQRHGPHGSCPGVDGIRQIVLAENRERERAIGSNGGQLCDARRGPCSCGAWH